MIPPDHLSARTVSIQPSNRRAPARYAEVRSNSDDDRDDACSKDEGGLHFALGSVSALPNPRSPTLRRTPDHLPPIEIP